METSLTQLLALAKQSNDLSKSIFEAARLAGLPQGWHVARKSPQPEEAHIKKRLSGATAYHARAEWVLRWILDRLRHNDENGKEARRNNLAWILLYKLLALVPISKAARHLNQAGFLAFFEKTLEENLQNFEEPRVPEDVMRLPKEGSLDISESSATIEDDLTISRKRKRDDGTEEIARKKNSTLNEQDFFDTVKAMSLALNFVVHRSSSACGTDNLVSKEHMKSVLRVKTAQAANILSLWLKCFDGDCALREQDLIGLLPHDSHPLSDIVSIWESRVIEEDSEKVQNRDFISKCLVPITLILSHPVYSNRQAIDRIPGPLPYIDLYERHLGRHVLADSRRSYKESNVMEQFQPLSNAVATRSKMAVQTERPRKRHLALMESLPKLFDVAVRCTNRTTHQSRQRELSWIHAVFKDLMSSAGYPLDGDEVACDVKSASSLILQLLKYWPENMLVPPKTLSEIAKRYTGLLLDAASGQPIRWELIAKVGSLNQSIFEDRQEPSESKKVPSLGDILFIKITAEEYCSGGQSHEPQYSQEDERRHFVKQSVLFPILRDAKRPRAIMNFMERWHLQLAHIYSASEKPWDVSSVWEDCDLLDTAKLALDLCLSVKEWSELIKVHREGVVTFTELGSGRTSKETLLHQNSRPVRSVMASITLLRFILSSKSFPEWAESLQELLGGLDEDLKVLIQKQDFVRLVDMRKLWDIMSLIHGYLWPIRSKIQVSENFGELPELETLKIAHRYSTNETDISSFTIAARLSALRYVLNICSSLRRYDQLVDILKKYVSDLIKAVTQKHKSADQVDTFEKFDLCLNYYEAFVPYISVLEVVDAAVRSEYLDGLCFLVCTVRVRLFHERSPFLSVPMEDHPSSISASRVFNANMQIIMSSLSLPIKIQCVDMICKAFENEAYGHIGSKNRPAIYDLFESILFEVPMRLLDRSRRRQVVDWTTTRLLSESTWDDGKSTVKVLSLVIKYMQTASSNVLLVTDATVLWRIAKAGNKSQAEIENIQLFGELVKITLSHFFLKKEPHKLQQLHEIFLERLEETLRAKSLTGIPLTRIVIKAYIFKLLPALSLHKELLTKSTEEKLRASLQQAIGLLHRKEDLPSYRGLWACLPSYMGACAALTARNTVATAAKEGKTHKPSINEKALDLHGSSPLVSECLPNGLLTDSDERKDVSVEKFLSLLQQILQKNGSGEEPPAASVNSLLAYCGGVFSRLQAEAKTCLVNCLIERHDDRYAEWRNLQLLTKLLPHLEVTEAAHPANSQHARVFSELTLRLGQRMPLHSLISCIECILILFESPQFSLSQWSVDNLMASIQAAVLRSDDGNPGIHAGYIHKSLCRILTTLVSLHRKNLGGRFHLLIPALQVLLSCFFAPFSSATFVENDTVYSAWSKNGETRLGKDNATTYARLLTTLCSPSITSARGLSRRKGANEDLVDARKKAKAYAGQHIQYLITHFCQTELDGKLDPDLRAQLMPGIYACIDAVGEDGLRSMNSSLDHSSRAIWRGLYTDWTRFGRGSGR